MNLRFLWLVFLLLPFFSCPASTQGTASLAIPNNRKTLQVEHPSAEYQLLLNKADSLANEGQFTKAASMFSFIQENYGASLPVTLALGNLLRKTGRLNEARKLFSELYIIDPTAAAIGIAHCDFAADALAKVPDYDTYTLPFNTPESEFGLSFLQGFPCFSAFKCQASSLEKKPACSASLILYDEEKSALQRWRNRDGIDFESINICERGHKAVGLRGSNKDKYCLGQTTGKPELFIISIDKNGIMEKADLFPYSSIYPAIHSACLSSEGTELIFAAISPEGAGDLDLFRTVWIDNQWSIPTSLGETINTSGNEITPHFHNNTLYFASDQHPGLGGFDLFVSGRVEGEWLPPINIGNGINSLGDDYFPSLDGSGKLFFTSNRQGGMGKNDLYYGFRMSANALQKTEIPAAVALRNTDEESDHTWYPNRYAKPVRYTESQTKEYKLYREDPPLSKHTAQAKDTGPQVPKNKKSYYIQLISASTSKSTNVNLEVIRHFGDIYEVKNGNTLKFQLGKFTSEDEARQMLTSVKKAGFMDAFITQNIDVPPSSILLKWKKTETGQNKTEPQKPISKKEEYKIRIGAFLKENLGSQTSLEDLGSVERWTKGKLIILVLSGFEDLQTAKTALFQARKRGFTDAHLVVDRDGIFHKVREK